MNSNILNFLLFLVMGMIFAYLQIVILVVPAGIMGMLFFSKSLGHNPRLEFESKKVEPEGLKGWDLLWNTIKYTVVMAILMVLIGFILKLFL